MPRAAPARERAVNRAVANRGILVARVDSIFVVFFRLIRTVLNCVLFCFLLRAEEFARE